MGMLSNKPSQLASAVAEDQYPERKDAEPEHRVNA
jgi:hypothetical protein